MLSSRQKVQPDLIEHHPVGLTSRFPLYPVTSPPSLPSHSLYHSKSASSGVVTLTKPTMRTCSRMSPRELFTDSHTPSVDAILSRLPQAPFFLAAALLSTRALTPSAHRNQQCSSCSSDRVKSMDTRRRVSSWESISVVSTRRLIQDFGLATSWVQAIPAYRYWGGSTLRGHA